jgi:hypothetical protein
VVLSSIELVYSSRRIYGPKRDEVTEGWRKVHNNLCSSPSTVRMIKSMRMRWAGHVGRKEGRMHIGYWVESQKKRGNFKDQDVLGG